jgi:hypothetical protein
MVTIVRLLSTVRDGPNVPSSLEVAVLTYYTPGYLDAYDRDIQLDAEPARPARGAQHRHRWAATQASPRTAAAPARVSS